MAAKEETGPVEAVAVTGRPQDTPLPNTTFADRAAARRPKAKAKAEKAVQSSENKSAAGRAQSK